MKSLLWFLLLSSWCFGQGCSTWNQSAFGSDTLADYSNAAYHITGDHYMDAFRDGFCTYTNSGGLATECIASIRVSDVPTGKDTGLVDSLTHVGRFSQAGSFSAAKGAVSSPASAGVIVAACPFGVCNISISVTAGGLLAGGVTGGQEIWSAVDTYNGYCEAEYAGSPIMADLEDHGFDLVPAAKGPETEMILPEKRMRFAWPKPGSGNAFLYLDGHLFGNWTPQSPSPGCPDPFTGCGNGFEALKVYDLNHDGWIDERDPVFAQLKWWVDDGDGIVQPNELLRLHPGTAISLDYHPSKQIDAISGSRFGDISTIRGPDKDHTIIDVTLATN